MSYKRQFNIFFLRFIYFCHLITRGEKKRGKKLSYTVRHNRVMRVISLAPPRWQFCRSPLKRLRNKKLKHPVRNEYKLNLKTKYY